MSGIAEVPGGEHSRPVSTSDLSAGGAKKMKAPSLFNQVMGSVRGLTPILVVLSAAVNLLLLVTAIYMLQVYDRVLSSGSYDTLLWLTVIALFAIFVYAVLEQARRLILSRASVWIDRELTAKVLEGRMMARLAGIPSPAGPREVADLRNYYRSEASLALQDAPWGLIFIAFIWSLHPALGVIALGGAVTLFSLAVLNDLLTRPKQGETSGAVRAANEAAIRYLDSGETIRPLGMARAIFDAWAKRAAAARDSEQALSERTMSVVSVSRGIRMALQVLILGAGAYLVLGGQITAGAMIAASIILGRALAPIERLTGAWRKLLGARAAKKRLAEALEDVGTEEPRVSLPKPKGLLAATGVYLTPQGVKEPVLRDINFEVSPGQCLAVVGPSGSGKSSLCRVITGAWAPSAGHMRLDGADVFSWDPEELGLHMGYLPQRIDLFPGTIAENISRFGEHDSEGVIRAAKAAGSHEMILGLPDGYETRVEPQSEQISLGQRQRIGLARALYGSPSLVVLDEPNSNLDRAGEDGLHAAITELRKAGTTVVVVSHRASILKLADLVVTLREGRIEQFGALEQRPQDATPVKKRPGVRVKPAAKTSKAEG